MGNPTPMPELEEPSLLKQAILYLFKEYDDLNEQNQQQHAVNPRLDEGHKLHDKINQILPEIVSSFVEGKNILTRYNEGQPKPLIEGSSLTELSKIKSMTAAKISIAKTI
jgi:hypothetical protein